MNLTNIQRNEIAAEWKRWENSMSSPTFSLSTILGDSASEEPEFLKYEWLYEWITDERTRKLVSLMHFNFVREFGSMNTRLPTKDDTAYFWAPNSRTLIETIETSETLIRIYQNTSESFLFDDCFASCVELCKGFLVQFRGSTIPPYTSRMPIYFELPIFINANATFVLESEAIRAIDIAYVRGLFERTQEDFSSGHFDSVITKCRTLLEEVCHYAIAKKGETASKTGKISELWNQVKDLYNMKQTDSSDKRLNDLVTGLWKIIDSVAAIRNIGSDAHGVGDGRMIIKDYHAMLYLNASITVASFMVSVVENSNRSTSPKIDAV